MVLDHVPDDDEIEELAHKHLEEYPAEEAHARIQITYEPPEFLGIGEQDQIGAFMRDGAACILVIYMAEGEDCDDDDDEELDDW